MKLFFQHVICLNHKYSTKEMSDYNANINSFGLNTLPITFHSEKKFNTKVYFPSQSTTTGFKLFETIIYLHTLTTAWPQLFANCFCSYFLPCHILHILKSYFFIQNINFLANILHILNWN